jgi:hypothetical protein
MWEVAADSLLFLARIWHRPDDILPGDLCRWPLPSGRSRTNTSVVRQAGLDDVILLPVPDLDTWLLAARRSPWVVATVDAQLGLLPGRP